MPVAELTALLAAARQGRYAVGYFESWDQYSLEAVIETAEALRSPAILGFGAAVTNPAWLDAGGIEALSVLARTLAERARVPAAVLFNEAQTLEHAQRGLAAGCNAVMLDTSRLAWDENVRVTRKVVGAAHAAGAAVEAELGHLPTAGQPEDGPGTLTDPEDAARFVAETGIDALAVSIGNVHLLANGQASLDLDQLDRIGRATPVPMVLHGGTGIPAEAIGPAVARGVAKINYGTRLKQVFLAGVREAVGALPAEFNVHDFVGSRYDTDILLAGKRRLARLIAELMQLYGSAGQAA